MQFSSLSLSSQTAVKTRAVPTAILNTDGNGLCLSTIVVSHIKQKSLGFGGSVMVGKGVCRMCCFVSECSKDCVCGRVRLCEYSISSSWSYFLCHSRGSVLVAPGDSQSVLALQYKEIIVIFKKLPLRLGTVFCKAHVWDSSTWIHVCVWEFGCMLTVTVTHYIFI